MPVEIQKVISVLGLIPFQLEVMGTSLLISQGAEVNKLAVTFKEKQCQPGSHFQSTGEGKHVLYLSVWKHKTLTSPHSQGQAPEINQSPMLGSLSHSARKLHSPKGSLSSSTLLPKGSLLVPWKPASGPLSVLESLIYPPAKITTFLQHPSCLHSTASST